MKVWCITKQLLCDLNQSRFGSSIRKPVHCEASLLICTWKRSAGNKGIRWDLDHAWELSPQNRASGPWVQVVRYVSTPIKGRGSRVNNENCHVSLHQLFGGVQIDQEGDDVRGRNAKNAQKVTRRKPQSGHMTLSMLCLSCHWASPLSLPPTRNV